MFHAIVFLAPGFEEIEALTSVDVLRRAGIDVLTAAVTEDSSLSVPGAHDIVVEADVHVHACEAMQPDVVVFPGGMPGATNLARNAVCRAIALKTWQAGGIAAAICAAPIVLHAAGCLDAPRRYTCYPGFEQRIGGNYTDAERVVVDQRVITACGPGASLEFALAIVSNLCGEQAALDIRRAMLA